MKISEIYIKSFGKLKNFKLMPMDGVNIVYGENESGKTTVMAFIRAMFYGAGRGETRRRYDPWDGGRMGGLITFECNDKEYTLLRQFGPTRATDKIELWCKTTGEQVTLPDKAEPGEYLMKISELTFLNSVFIGQINPAIAGNNDEILAKLQNLASSGDETASRTEIEGRLKEAVAKLDSKRADALLPRLEAERMELLESRAKACERAQACDKLREEIIELETERERCTAEHEKLTEKHLDIVQRRRLAEIEAIITKKAALDEDEHRFEQLHEAIYGGGLSLDDEFVNKSREILEGCTSQQTVIKLKKTQYQDCCNKYDSIDRSKVGQWRTITKHLDEVDTLLRRYERLRGERAAAERRCEEYERERRESQINPKNILLVLGVAALCLILFGALVHWVFYLLAGIVVAGTAGYFYMKSRGMFSEPIPDVQNELHGIEQEIRDLQREKRPLLNEIGVASLEELRSEHAEMKRVSAEMQDAFEKKKTLKDEITELETEYEGIASKLREMLEPYARIDSNEQAVEIISKIDKKQREYAALEAKLESERQNYAEAIGEQDYELLADEAQELRTFIAGRGEAPETLELAELERTLEDNRTRLEKANTDLACKETELSVSTVDPQEVNSIDDKIKLLNERIERCEFELSALHEAIEALGEAFETMQRDFGPIINFKAGRILDELTDGRYNSVIISDQFVPSVAEAPQSSNIRKCTSMSLGTSDQIYLALRLAIAGILSDEKLPVFLDDAFAQYDDKRLTDALFYLARESGSGEIGQVLIFTCHEKVCRQAAEVGIKSPIIPMLGR